MIPTVIAFILGMTIGACTGCMAIAIARVGKHES